eukprot:TRINITY_DN4258_c1_g1_i1.p1 TRINITY_DN4258_c1_g1~~TRINITY_DN4258_c1_g1_i1.p1  ORF type:complete len:359 (+),score=45.46 TRINITY_DN4258_c1_g1_i1:98-1174(+)
MQAWCGVFNITSVDGQQVGVSASDGKVFLCRVPEGHEERDLSDIYAVEWNGDRTRISPAVGEDVFLYSQNNQYHDRLIRKIIYAPIRTPGVAESPHPDTIYTPVMPPFLPGVRPDHSSVMLSYPKYVCSDDEDKDFTLHAANEDFWHFFVAVLEVNKHSRDTPHYKVKLQGDTKPGLLVNADFVKSYISGWHQVNPYVVIVTSQGGDRITFRCPEQFVLFLIEFIHNWYQANKKHGSETVVVSIAGANEEDSGNRLAIRCGIETWNEVASTWEKLQNTTAEHRVQLLTCIHMGTPIPSSLLYGGDSADDQEYVAFQPSLEQPARHRSEVSSRTKARRSNNRYWVNFVDEWELAERSGW